MYVHNCIHDLMVTFISSVFDWMIDRSKIEKDYYIFWHLPLAITLLDLSLSLILFSETHAFFIIYKT